MATDRNESKRLLSEYFETDTDDPKRQVRRDELVREFLPLVHYLARKMTQRSELLDDVVQVGCIGLLNALDRFDPTRGIAFSTFAVPTIAGEIRRHFRDTGWSMRVPRRAQELQTGIREAETILAQRLQRAPTIDELSAELDVASEIVLEAKHVATARNVVSTDALLPDEERSERMQIVSIEEGYHRAEARTMLRPALHALPPREQQILLLRFYDERTQAEIAGMVGLSQMQVSRLITRSLTEMRARLCQDEDAELLASA